MELNFKYTLTKDEAIDFHLKNVVSTKYYKKKFWIQILIFLISAMIALSINIFFAIPVIILSMFNKKILLDELRRNFKTYYSFNKYNNTFEETITTINDSGIKCITRFGEKMYSWEGIKKIHMVEGTMFFQSFMLLETFVNEDLIMPLGKIYEFTNVKTTLEDIVKKSNLDIIYGYPANIKYF